MRKKIIVLLLIFAAIFTMPTVDAKAKYSKSACKKYAYELVTKKYKWSQKDYDNLIKLWNKESGWNTLAKSRNGAYGIPQAYPGSKMKSEGKDYKTNCKVQIRWGLKYIKKKYKNPTKAWNHFKKRRWY